MRRNLVHILLIIVCGLILYGCPYPLPRIEAEISTNIQNDTTIIDYYIRPYHPYVKAHDSATISINFPHKSVSIDSLIYSSIFNISDSSVNRQVKMRDGRPFLKGKLVYPMSIDTSLTYLSVTIYGDFHYRGQHSHLYEFRPSVPKWLAGFGIGNGWFNKSFMPTELRPHAIWAGVAVSGEGVYLFQNAGIGIGFEYMGQKRSGRETSFSSRFILLKYYFLRTNEPLFIPYICYGESESILRNQDLKRQIKDFGFRAGFSIEHRFESLSYSYSTALNGFHKVRLTFRFIKWPFNSLGTEYTMNFGPNVKHYVLQYYLILGKEVNDDTRFVDDRGPIQKILASGYLAPLYLIYYVVQMF